MVRQKVCGQINQWNFTMIIDTAIQNIYVKVWTYYFVSVNLHPCHRLSFADWIKNIALTVNMGDTVHFWNHERSYYDYMPAAFKNMTGIK